MANVVPINSLSPKTGGLQIAQKLGQFKTGGVLAPRTNPNLMGTADHFAAQGMQLPGELAGAAKPIQDAYMKSRMLSSRQSPELAAARAGTPFPQGSSPLPSVPGGGVPGQPGQGGTNGAPGGVNIPPPYPHDGSFNPMQSPYGGNPGLEKTLMERAQGNTGGPSWDEVVSGSYDPMSKIIDQNTKRSTDAAIEDLISRGVLTSSTSVRAVADLAQEAANQKNAYLGQLGLQFNQQKQEAIGQALSTLGVLEGNKISASATITSANIQATASVKAAAIGADAHVQAATINAQAMLQRANGDWKNAIAMKEMEINQSWEQQGIDPERFKSDPAYRDSVIKYFAEQRESLDVLRRAAYEQELAGGAFE